MSKKTSNVDVEALVAATTNLPTAAVVSSALANLQKKQAEEAEAAVIENISTIQKIVEVCVDNLKQTRKQEKRRKEILQIVADAQAEFLKTGDFEAFREAVKDHVFVSSNRW